MVHYSISCHQGSKSEAAEVHRSFMNGHSLARYRDGHSFVHYCEHCGAEGDKLLEKCEKVIDKKEEQT